MTTFPSQGQVFCSCFVVEILVVQRNPSYLFLRSEGLEDRCSLCPGGVVRGTGTCTAQGTGASIAVRLRELAAPGTPFNERRYIYVHESLGGFQTYGPDPNL